MLSCQRPSPVWKSGRFGRNAVTWHHSARTGLSPDVGDGYVRLQGKSGGREDESAGAQQLRSAGRERSEGRDLHGLFRTHGKMSQGEDNFVALCRDVTAERARESQAMGQAKAHLGATQGIFRIIA